MIIAVNVRLLDGRMVAIVPGAVAAVEEIGPVVSPNGPIVPAHAQIVLLDGTRYSCAPIDGPAGMPQPIALVNAINGALEQIGRRLDTRRAIAGG